MANTYLSKVQTTGTDRKIQTFSTWVKKCQNPASDNVLLSSYFTADERLTIYFDSSQQLTVFTRNGGSNTIILVTNRLFRDVSAWYHIVVAFDTTQATSSNRVKIYVNGVQETSFVTAIYPSLNEELRVGASLFTYYLGAYAGTSGYLDGSMSHIHNIDGTAYDADTFGETDATTGIWRPKTAPSVTYGTNGFFLKGENSGSLGTDSSGNANNFTVNGTPTQTIDTPSNVFCTGNPLYRWNYNSTQTNGNTTFTGTQSQWEGVSGTLGISKGKYYYEVKITNDSGLSNGSTAMIIGFMGLDDYNITNATRNLVGLYSFDGGEIFVADTVNNFATTADYGTFATNDIMGVALDYDNELISYYKNGSAIATNFDYGATAYSSTLKGGKTITPVFISNGVVAVSANFGNGFFGTTAVASATTDESGLGIFEYDVPTGYYALCTKNINEQEYS